MRLLLNKKYPLAFVSYLWKLMKKEILKELNSKETLSELNSKSLEKFSNEFGFNYLNAIEFAFNHPKISETDDYRLVAFSNYAKYHDLSCSKIIDILTYGTRTIKGVSIIKDKFNEVNENEFNEKNELLYEGWLHGN